MKARNGQNTRRPMRRTSRRAAFVLAALAILTTQSSLASVALAAAPPPLPVEEKTELDIFPLSAISGAVGGSTFEGQWNNTVAGYNIVRTFKNILNQTFMFLINGNTGRAKIHMLNGDGTPGSVPWQSAPSPVFRCTSAELVRTGGVTYLFMHDSFIGQVRKLRMNEDGSPNIGSMIITTHNDWKDKNLFSLYSFNGAYYLLGCDTYTGAVVAYSINNQKIAASTWTRGWTSVDHLETGGVTYRTLYKAAGDPHKKPGESGDQAGRFLVQKVAANGVDFENIYDSPLLSNYSTVRFATIPDGGGGWKHMIFFYNRSSGLYFMYGFDAQQGLGPFAAVGHVDNDEAQNLPYVDVEPYTVSGQTYMAFIKDDDSEPFNYDRVEKMAHTIHDGLVNEAVGYQIMVAQSGRVIYSRAWGKSKLSNVPAEEVNMTPRTRFNLGSVSKMITTMTVLKLADNGVIPDIEGDKIIQHLNPMKYPANNLHQWVQDRPVINLLTHTSGLDEKQGGTCSKEPGNKMDCTNFFSTTPQLPCDGPGEECNRNYNNYNTNAARIVIESKTGAESSEEIVAKTRELWAYTINLGGINCVPDAGVSYFGKCNGAPDCFSFNGQLWRQMETDGTASESCSAGGWNATAYEMIEFLAGIRYKKLLVSPHLNELLTSTTMSDLSGSEGSTALGWEKPWSANGVPSLGKNGGWSQNGIGFKAYITRLPNNCDAVVLVNTAADVGVTELVQNAYNLAVQGQ